MHKPCSSDVPSFINVSRYTFSRFPSATSNLSDSLLQLLTGYSLRLPSDYVELLSSFTLAVLHLSSNYL